MKAKELRESVKEYCVIYQYSSQYTTALTEACVALKRWPRDLDDEVWSQRKHTLKDRLAYLRKLVGAKP